MARRVAAKDIEYINEVYYLCKSYSKTAQATGWSAATVRKYVIDGYEQTLNYMSSLLSLIKIKLSSSCYYIFLMLDVVLKHVDKWKNLRLVINKRKHVNAKCIFQLCMLIKII